MSENNHKEEIEEDDEIITLSEYFNQQDKHEEEVAEVVLGGSEDSDKCSYPQGYMTRQAVFACQTCLDVSNVSAGVCHGCAVTCHEDHDLIELYTKRHFRCDCGNSKFPESFKCSLVENKDAVNVENNYNHNFEGLYCTCNKPYPDDEINDEMIGCCICEDWFHVSHLSSSSEEYDEFTCGACMEQHKFLNVYKESLSLTENVDVVAESSDDGEATASKRLRLSEQCRLQNLRNRLALLNPINKGHTEISSTSNEQHVTMTSPSASTNEEKTEITSSSISTKEENVEMTSSIFSIKEQEVNTTSSSGVKDLLKDKRAVAFWPENWRVNLLCHCDECKMVYAEQGISYLTNIDDSVSNYAQKGRERLANMKTKTDGELSKALNQMPRPAAIYIASEMAKLKENMKLFFSTHKDSNTPITAEDVKHFISDCQNKRDTVTD